MIYIIKSIEDFDSEELCEYCVYETSGYATPYGYESCEGSKCQEAYERYLEENDISERAVNISKKVKIIIERKDK